MPALTYNTAAGDLTIGGVALNGPAWKVLNLLELWQPADQRGSDRLVPGTAGVLAQQRRDTVTRRSLQMLIVGDVDRTGTPQADRFEGLQANVEYLRANVAAPTGATDGTRSAVLTMPDGTTRTEPVHVVGFDFGNFREDAAWLRAVLTISIPSGRIQ
jgi:hypothetical protein